MKGLLLTLLALAPVVGLGAQTIPPPGEINAGAATDAPAPPAADSTPPPAGDHPPESTGHSGRGSAAEMAMEHLTRSNQELLDLLKKQQAVLEDIQYDRRLQNRQITLLEQRLEDTLQENAALQAKVARLEATAAAARSTPAAGAQASDNPAPNHAAPDATTSAPPAPPISMLPPEQTEGEPGTMWWHRITSLSGTDSQNSEMFRITGKQWRVLWHNQDRPGDSYKNTSALFISAFPKNDTLPKKVCSQLGTGGDSTELTGTGNFYLKVEASGGSWELAVEDFR